MQKIYVVVRKSDGKFLRKNKSSFTGRIAWRTIFEIQAMENRSEYNQHTLDSLLSALDGYFTDKLGEARIMNSAGKARTHSPTWRVYMGQDADPRYRDVDWLKDGTCEVREMVCFFSGQFNDDSQFAGVLGDLLNG